MAITTGINSLADAQARLQLFLDAEEAVSKSQAYSIGDRSLSRADAGWIAERIDHYQRIVEAFKSGMLGVRNPRMKVVTWVG